MPDAPDTTLDPVAEVAAPEQQAPVAESTDVPNRHRPFSFARAVNAPSEPSPVLNATDPAAPKPETTGTDGESPSDEGLKPTTAPTPGERDDAAPKPSRRDQGKEGNLARIAELEAAVKAETEAREAAIAAATEQARADERDRIERERTEAASTQEQEAVGRKHLEDVQRLQRLMRVPDAELSGEDYAWREEQKELLAKYPQVERHYQTVAEQQIAAERAEIEAKEATFWDGVRGQIAKANTLPHVVADDLRQDAPKPLTTWDQMAGYYHAAGAAWKEAEYTPQLAQRDERIGQLEEEVRDLKLVGPRGLGSARAPVNGGRSAGSESGPQTFDPSRSSRLNLSEALMAPSNGQR